MNRTSLAVATWPALLAVAVLSVPAARAVEDFNVFLLPFLPDTAVVTLGQTMAVPLYVDSTAHQFNGYEVTLQYDPDVVSFQSFTPGPLFTEHCPQSFIFPTLTDSTVTYAHVLLCAGVSLDGPGVCSTFTFHADNAGISPVTIVSDPDRSFVDGGLYIWPGHPAYPRQVVFHNAVIRVVELSGVSPRPSSRDRSGDGLSLRLSPNPVHGQGVLQPRLPQPASVQLAVFDAGGQMVGRWSWGERPAGEVSLPLDLRATGQAGLAAGNYFCRVSAAGISETFRIAAVR